MMFARHALRATRHSRNAPSTLASRQSFRHLDAPCHQLPASSQRIRHNFRSISIPARLPHDVGGDTSSFGSLASKLSDPDSLLDWEIQCHSLFAVLAIEGVVTTDGLRRSIESLTPRQYASWTYYEKWAAGMTTLLLERGAVTTDELNEALFGKVTVSADGEMAEPLFDTGDYVRVRSHRRGGNSMEWRRPHIRVPGYIYGVRGVVERVCGEHKDPSFLAFGLQAPNARLYRVRFQMKDVWPEHHHEGDTDDDVIEVEVYEPWLQKSDKPHGRDFEGSHHALFDHTHDGSDCSQAYNNDHNHDRQDHSHDPRPSVEERAISLEGEPRPGKELYSALVKVLTEKGVITPGEVREMSEKLVMAGQTLHGASLIAKAWVDPAFQERLLNDAPSAAAEINIVTSNPNAPTVLTIVKNTDKVHNLVVCTLCSCYPSGLLGIAPSWYKSGEYRSRAVREPREVLLEFGTSIPPDCQIRVHDSTADHRYLVLPVRPEGTEGWTEDELRSLVTRDCMVGVSVPRVLVPAR